ncbi:hypothetical protein [Roseovarius aestuariivivens]|uniref:hypothetical protein n=1 Tax=Roseovarius aestuariivivens TaxID=1888910 RepID=UPI001080671D|nr:hypothetical protein [Roseovarius aestuariivivens]
MTSEGAVTPAEDLIVTLFESHARHDYETCYEAAIRILSQRSFDNLDEYSEAEALGMFFAKAFEKSAEAGHLAMQRRYSDAAATFQQMAEVVNVVNWREGLDENPIFREYRKLDLIARIQKLVMEAVEAVMRGSFGESSLKVLAVETYLPEIRSILSKTAPETEHYMRQTAFALVSGYFMIGAMSHVQNATLGNKLLQARLFFERMDTLLDEFSAVDGMDSSQQAIISVMHAYAGAARLRVQAEIAAAEDDYDGAITNLTQSMLAFEHIAPIIPADMPGNDMLRESVVNTGAAISQSIRHFQALQSLSSRLEMAMKTRADLEEQLKEMDRKRDEIIKAFARQHMNVSIQNVNEIAAEIQINNEASVTMQNSGMDQVIQLLGQMPQSDEAQKLKQEAEKAKEEKDIAKKIEKVAAVIDGASKLADAAAKLVPYGPAVMGALKGVFGLLPLIKREAEAETEDRLPETRMT